MAKKVVHFLTHHIFNPRVPLVLWEAASVDLGTFPSNHRGRVEHTTALREGWDRCSQHSAVVSIYARLNNESYNDHLTAFDPGQPGLGRYQKKHSPTHTHPDHRASFIIFLHLQRSMASSLFNLRA